MAVTDHIEGEEQEPNLQFFSYSHLPEPLKSVSREFSRLAENLMAVVPANPQRTLMIEKLIEAKDCAVRAKLYRGE